MHFCHQCKIKTMHWKKKEKLAYTMLRTTGKLPRNPRQTLRSETTVSSGGEERMPMRKPYNS